MPTRFISRTSGVPSATRSAVAFGKVFSYLDKQGNVKQEQFVALGASDRLYSVKTSNGELSSSPLSKGSAGVVIVGKAKIVVELFKKESDYHKDFRAQLRVGDAYRVTKTGPIYVHLGELTDGRFFALNTDSKDYATTDTKEKEVLVVGYGQFEVETTV